MMREDQEHSADKSEDRELTRVIIRAAYRVHRQLGAGLPESAYVRAVARELERARIRCTLEKRFSIRLGDSRVGEIRVDLDVERMVVVEIKASARSRRNDARLEQTTRSQILSYLRVSGRPIGLAIDFGTRLAVKRFVLTQQGRCK